MLKPTTKTQPSRLQIALDQELGFEHRIDSRITYVKRGFDNTTGEHIVWIEYRTRVHPGTVKKAPTNTKYPLMQQVNAGLPKP